MPPGIARNQEQLARRMHQAALRTKRPASNDITRGWCRLMGLAPRLLFTTCLAALGVHPRVAMQILRHSRIAITM